MRGSLSSPADDAHALTSLTSLLAAAAAAAVPGVQASTSADLHDIVTVEGEKQSLKCDSGSLSSCTASSRRRTRLPGLVGAALLNSVSDDGRYLIGIENGDDVNIGTSLTTCP